MKKSLMIIVSVLAVFTLSTVNAQSSAFNKNSPQLKALGSTFKNHSHIAPKVNSNDITMGYAGQDVSRQPVILF